MTKRTLLMALAVVLLSVTASFAGTGTDHLFSIVDVHPQATRPPALVSLQTWQFPPSQ